MAEINRKDELGATPPRAEIPDPELWINGDMKQTMERVAVDDYYETRGVRNRVTDARERVRVASVQLGIDLTMEELSKFPLILLALEDQNKEAVEP